ncbi:MAG: 16S rRNA processing protein RimM [Chitinophagaceae bacterium]|nr:MAG: 16S rRNA processing protein RimM [Chitinophagaceae bacterium]
MEAVNHTPIGKITKTHGLKGEVRIKLNFTFLFPENYAPEVLFLGDNHTKPIPFFVENFNAVKENEAIVKFEDISDKDDAEKLKNLYFFTDEEESRLFIVENEESKLSYLSGYRLLDEQQNIIGTIDTIRILPAHPVAVLHIKNEEVLIPLHNDLILEIRKESKEIVIKIPDGLLSLYNL